MCHTAQAIVLFQLVKQVVIHIAVRTLPPTTRYQQPTILSHCTLEVTHGSVQLHAQKALDIARQTVHPNAAGDGRMLNHSSSI